MTKPPDRPLRLLVVCPSWVGDVVMATPVLRLLRDELPGAFIGGLVRPGCDRILAGAGFFDELHIERPSGVLGPKFVAAKIRPRRYDTALLLTNSFSTALITRIAGVPRRFGYDRDGRGFLLTNKIKASKRPGGRRVIVPAVESYWRIATHMLAEFSLYEHAQDKPPSGIYLELATTEEDQSKANEILNAADVGNRPFVVLNPGGNNPAKRWPTERFAKLGDELASTHVVLINGSPAEQELVDEIIAHAHSDPVSLAALGNTLGSLKSIVRRAALMVTNDTGPRHLAVAFGTPVVSLFGPTDHRWTTVPTRPGGDEVILLADPDLPESESANDNPERCRIDRIGYEVVRDAAIGLLGGSAADEKA